MVNGQVAVDTVNVDQARVGGTFVPSPGCEVDPRLQQGARPLTRQEVLEFQRRVRATHCVGMFARARLDGSLDHFDGALCRALLREKSANDRDAAERREYVERQLAVT